MRWKFIVSIPADAWTSILDGSEVNFTLYCEVIRGEFGHLLLFLSNYFLHRLQQSYYLLIFAVIFFFLGYFVYRGSNSQKNEFRKNPYSPIMARKYLARSQRFLYFTMKSKFEKNGKLFCIIGILKSFQQIGKGRPDE